jgi:hypothetical protein
MNWQEESKKRKLTADELRQWNEEVKIRELKRLIRAPDDSEDRVWVLTEYTHSDYRILGVYSTKEKAEEALSQIRQGLYQYDISTHIVDAYWP